ncbi:MAG: cupin domain-containing protein [Gammaproteobacteria bacterium]
MPYLKNNLLGSLSPEQFLQDYWQKQPCLIRQAIPDYQCPLSPEELAGLAWEEGVEARLVLEKGGEHPWQVKYGPFAEPDFRSLPDTHWTLLVEGVEQYHEKIYTLLDHFRFVPNWRIDDVIISFAATHGGTGSHLDRYDVFLLQGRGRRRWQINCGAYTEKNFIPDLELRIIGNFHAEQEWVLEPGDLLYLPPGVAHNGVALEPCVTLSIGFLAPLSSELAGNFIDETISGTAQDTRFADPGRPLQKYPGEISSADLDRIGAMMRSSFRDEALLQEWFGKYISRGRGGPESKRKKPLDAGGYHKKFREKKTMVRSNGVRTAFIQQHGRLLLFVNGESVPLDRHYLELVIMITEQAEIRYRDLEPHASCPEFCELLRGLYNLGMYHF